MLHWRRRLVVCVSLLAGACAHAPARTRYVAPDYGLKAPPRIAVLPFDNEAVDLNGPEILRALVHNRLSEHGYQALSVDGVDESLKELGVSEGGQLRNLEPAAVAKAVGAEGLLYGTVEEFTMQNVGFVARRVVRLRLVLVRGQGGERLWEDTGEGMTGSITFDKKQAQRVFLEGLLERGLENLVRTPLMPESKLAVQDLFSRLPRR